MSELKWSWEHVHQRFNQESQTGGKAFRWGNLKMLHVHSEGLRTLPSHFLLEWIAVLRPREKNPSKRGIKGRRRKKDQQGIVLVPALSNTSIGSRGVLLLALVFSHTTPTPRVASIQPYTRNNLRPDEVWRKEREAERERDQQRERNGSRDRMSEASSRWWNQGRAFD